MKKDLKVLNNNDLSQYESLVDDYKAIVKYEIKGGDISLYSVKVPKQLEGKGVGSKLVNSVLVDVKANGLKLLRNPICPFVKAYIERHSDKWNDIYTSDSNFIESDSYSI